MEIQGQQISRVNSPQGIEQAGAAKVEAKADQPSQQTPAVEVSDRARQMSEISELVQNSDDVRSDLVADLKAKIDAGEYKVDFDQLATNMAEEL